MNNQTIYITGEARTTIDNAITKMFGTFYIAFEIILSTDEIVDVDCNATLRLTRDFVNRLFLNHNIIKDEEMLKKEGYFQKMEVTFIIYFFAFPAVKIFSTSKAWQGVTA